MTAQWAVEMAGDSDDLPLVAVATTVIHSFADGAATPGELPELHRFAESLDRGTPMSALRTELRDLSHTGYLRGALVAMASSLQRMPRADVALALARELMDALDPALGVEVCRGVLALPEVDTRRHQQHSTFVTANRLVGEALLEASDPSGALRHFEAVLSVDVDDARALRGWSTATRALEERGIEVAHRSRGLALLEGVDELELSSTFGDERYELGRPLGRGRHAVVYQAFDRHVRREVAIKRLLDPKSQTASVPPRVLEARFFAEARTLSRVRSPYVVALLDARPKRRFIALELCRGGNLRLALRRGLVGADDLPRVGTQLGAALAAVHETGAIHRDVKPANILVRHARADSSIALADFGLAIGNAAGSRTPRAGTLRYLAPELRRADAAPSASSDRYSAAVVLLELALSPKPLPEEFDTLEGALDAAATIPQDLPQPWIERLQRLLSAEPEERTW